MANPLTRADCPANKECVGLATSGISRDHGVTNHRNPNLLNNRPQQCPPVVSISPQSRGTAHMVLPSSADLLQPRHQHPRVACISSRLLQYHVSLMVRAGNLGICSSIFLRTLLHRSARSETIKPTLAWSLIGFLDRARIRSPSDVRIRTLVPRCGLTHPENRSCLDTSPAAGRESQPGQQSIGLRFNASPQHRSLRSLPVVHRRTDSPDSREFTSRPTSARSSHLRALLRSRNLKRPGTSGHQAGVRSVFYVCTPPSGGAP